MKSAPIAEFVAVSKDYPLGLFPRRSLRALDQISFRLQPGEVFGVIGPNRAGKTTLVKLLLSLARPTSGRVQRLGEPATQRQTLSRVGYMHEHQAFPRYLSADGVLAYYGTLAGVPAGVLRTRIPTLLKQVELADRIGDRVARFSKGMIARLGLAQALLNDPCLLVLDEPYEGLDLDGQALAHDIIRKQRLAGKTVVLITHSIDEIEKLCDRVLLLKQGRSLFQGTLGDLVRDPQAGSGQSLPQVLQRFFHSAI